MAFNINQRLNGLNPLSYIGDNAVQPPDFVTKARPPNSTDSKNHALGDIWLDMTGYPGTLPTNEDVWMLVALVGNQATWVNFGGGDLETLTGNSGGPVSPDGADNINIVGNGTTITVVGTPINNTLTINTVATAVVSTLTGNSGGAVSPTAGNINVLGTGVITVVGTPGTSTLTITPSGAIASSFPTDSGTATPVLGALKIWANNAALGAGSSVKFTGSTNEVLLNVTDASSNTIVGNNAGNLTLTGTNSVGLGKTVLHALTSGINNTVIGSLSGILITTGASNTIVGEGSGTAFTTGSNNILVGQGAGTAMTGAESSNLIIGTDVGRAGNNGHLKIGNTAAPGATWTNNIFIGHNTGNNTFTIFQGANNNVVGGQALQSLTTGIYNNLLGSGAGFSITTGSSNNLIGNGAGFFITGGNNTGIGHDVYWNSAGGTGLTTGTFNIAIGSGSAVSYTGAESGNILIANPGVVGESNIIRIGTAGSHVKNFQAGIRGITTDAADAIAVLISSTGQLGTVSSSIVFKENVQDMNDASSSIMNLRPVTFNYKSDVSKKTNYGLIAEEVDQVMPELVAHDHEGEIYSVKYHELVPMLLNELQKLHHRVAELENALN